MGALDNQPDNKNFLYPTNFRFVLQRAPNLTYFSQSGALPSITLGQIDHETPFIKIPEVGDKLVFDAYSLRFRVDESMANYLEVYNWLQDVGFPDNFGQSKFRSPEQVGLIPSSEVLSDGTLMVLTNAMNPRIQITFIDMFPISLAPVNFDSTVSDSTPLECDVSFAYRKFELELI